MDSTKTITHVGLCAGYGGIELGLKRVIPNLRTVALCEIEAFAIANLVAKMEAGLMDPAPIWPDLKTFPWGAFRDQVGLLTGGYPCQPFSAAGKRAGKDDPRHLWPWIADGIDSMRPSICFFENVEGHISLGLSNVIEDLGRMGYRTTWGIFSAAEVGAPHQRKRVFILANRNDEGLERAISKSIQRQSREFVGHNNDDLANTHNSGSGQDQLSSELWTTGVEQSSRGSWLSSKPYEIGKITVWPSRPSIPQHSWEPPRVVISMENAISQRGWSQGGDVIHERRSTSETRREGVQATTGWSPSATISNHQSASRDGGEGEAAIVGDTKVGQGHRRESGDMGLEASQGGRGNDAVDVTGQAMENTIRSGGEEPSAQPADLSPESSGRDTEIRRNERQTESSLGRNPDGTARGLDYSKLCVSGDNRTDELRLLGNGVVPATAELAFRTLFSSLDADL